MAGDELGDVNSSEGPGEGNWRQGFSIWWNLSNESGWHRVEIQLTGVAVVKEL